MGYYLLGAKLGSEDTYGRVFDGEDRLLVKCLLSRLKKSSSIHRRLYLREGQFVVCEIG